ncbi:MAG: hypothetical protein ACXWL2_00490 [Candidatus Chromulinivorax sp.]
MKKLLQILTFTITAYPCLIKNSDQMRTAYHEAGHAAILHAKIKKGLPCKIEDIQLAEKIGIISSKGTVSYICDSQKIDRDPRLGRMLTQVFLGGFIGEQILENKTSKNFAQIVNRPSTLDDRVQAQTQCNKIRSREALTDSEKMDLYIQATTDKDLQYLLNLQIMNEEYDRALQYPNLQSNVIKLAKVLKTKPYLSGTEVNEILK